MAVSLYLASLAGVVGKSFHMHNQDSEWFLNMSVVARLKLGYLIVYRVLQSLIYFYRVLYSPKSHIESYRVIYIYIDFQSIV